MFFNRITKKIATVLSVAALSVSLLPLCAVPITTHADETSYASMSTFKFADIDLQVSVPDDLVCFTQNVTSNNAYLEKIGAENAEGLRNSMMAAHIYLEAILKDTETVNSEIIIMGDKFNNDEITDLSALSQEKLDELLVEYTKNINKKTDTLEETLNKSSIETINGVTYFYTDITSITESNKTILLRKYYTIKNGYYYTYSLQTSEKNIDKDINTMFMDIIESAQYKEIKAGLFNNPIFSEVFSIAVTSLAPVAILGLILFISIKMTTKKKH